MKDTLPPKPQRGFYIVDSQSSFEGNGTQYTAPYYDNQQSYHFDGYGVLAPVKDHNKIIPYLYDDK